MTEQIKKPCQRCGEIKELKEYQPNLGKHPGKTINVCEGCAGKDSKLIAVVQPSDVPEINPAVPEAEKVEATPVIKEFKAVEPETIKIATPKNAPPQEQTKNPGPEPDHPNPLSNESISRESIRTKLADCEKDANSLRESKQRILAQAEQVKAKLQEVQNMINVTNVRIANYRDLLGEQG